MAVINGTSGRDTLIGTMFGDSINGLDGNDLLTGLEGRDTLDGGVGADTLLGGPGSDAYLVDNAGDRVFENASGGSNTVYSSINYTLPSDIEWLVLQGTAISGIGNNLDNPIAGNASNNRLWGGDGDDSLTGLGGADTMFGGAGNDWYAVEDAGDLVIETPGMGNDRVYSTVDYSLPPNIEDLYLRGNAIAGTGNTSDNRLAGNQRDNVLDGRSGDDFLGSRFSGDTLIGGTGDDTFYAVSPDDQVTENPNSGIDRIVTGESLTLPANVEILELNGNLSPGPAPSLNGTGNNLDNIIYGEFQVNVLSGGDGNDALYGDDEGDYLFGDGGKDTLDGGTGDDLLAGGADADTFQFSRPTDGIDLIWDFMVGTDRVAIDNAGFGVAGTGSLAANGIDFVLGSAATSAHATILFDVAAHQLMWDADGTGAGGAQVLAIVSGVNTLSAGDVVIV
jgi:Ca2+-binding RTX toxin-like protein